MLRIRALRATSDITRSSIRSSSGHDFGVKEPLLLRTHGDADYSPETFCLRETGLILLNRGIRATEEIRLCITSIITYYDRNAKGGWKMSGMANEVYEMQIISVEHVTIRSSNSFDFVRTKLETLLPRLDDGIFTLLRYGQTERALRELEASPTLSIFGFRDYGGLLTIAGLQCRAIQYDIGNPFTASKMARHQISAGLYAPIRVLLREDSGGLVAFEYDRPVSTFGQFGDNDVDIVARQLDQDLQSALEAAAS